MSSASERENQVMNTINRIRLQPCTCPLKFCPFNNTCDLCVRNHRLDGTIVHCMLPPIPERDNCGECKGVICSYYPDCRSPVLWLIYFARHPEKLAEWLGRIRNPRLKRKIGYILEVLSSPGFRGTWRELDDPELEEKEARERLRSYSAYGRAYFQRLRSGGTPG